MNRTTAIRRGSTWLVLGTSLAAGLLFVALRGIVPSDGARAAFYGGAWSAAGIRIAPIDEPAVGLVAGDVVAAIDGTDLEAWAQVATDSSVVRPTPDAPIPYRIIRAGEPVTVAVAWRSPASGWQKNGHSTDGKGIDHFIDVYGEQLIGALFAALANA